MALYYLSRMKIGAEYNYSPVDKKCLALMYALQKPQHYLVRSKVLLISWVNPIKILMTKTCSLSSRVAKWAKLLTQYDIEYVPQKAMKGQVLANFLASHPLLKGSPLNDALPNETVIRIMSEVYWRMFFDKASCMNQDGERISGVGILLIDPNGCLIPHAYSLV